MADITMCNNKKCPSKGLCHRVTATPSRWQSYSYFHKMGNPGQDWDSCAAYIPNEKAKMFEVLATPSDDLALLQRHRDLHKQFAAEHANDGPRRSAIMDQTKILDLFTNKAYTKL